MLGSETARGLTLDRLAEYLESIDVPADVEPAKRACLEPLVTAGVGIRLARGDVAGARRLRASRYHAGGLTSFVQRVSLSLPDRARRPHVRRASPSRPARARDRSTGGNALMVYSAVNPAILVRIPPDARRVLDVGCGDGALGRAIKARRPTEVVGVTCSGEEARRARGILDEVVSADLESADLAHLGTFDCIVCSHVLEHLREPARVLSRLRNNLASDGIVLIALPNTLHYRQRLAFLAGRFRYTDGGLMDRTHYRFFDWDTARGLVREAGLHLVEARADGGFPGSRFLGPLARRSIARLSASCPGLFGVQFVLTAKDGGRE